MPKNSQNKFFDVNVVRSGNNNNKNNYHSF